MITRLTARIDQGPNAEARAWTARLLASICGFPFRVEVAPLDAPQRSGPLLYYGRRKGLAGVTVVQSDFFDGDLRTTLPTPREPASRLDGIPVVFGTGVLSRVGDSTWIAGDIFASAFFLASRIEERAPSERDKHNRFPAAASFLGRNGILERPIVDEYARLVAGELTRIYPALTRRYPWPVVSDFAVCVTHDIETLKAPSRLGYLKSKVLSGGRAAAKGQLAKGLETSAAGLIRALSGHNPTWSFDRLRDPVRPWPATFFLFGGAGHPLDGGYDAESEDIREILAALSADGCEIGVHLGYDTLASDTLMRAQALKVSCACNRGVRGARHHYLRAEFPAAWRAHGKAGFAYDASLGFAEAPGFRAGTSYPFRPFDVDAGRELAVYEVPLVAMDGSFFQYQHLSPEETISRLLRLARTVERSGGVFTLLWHNTMVDPVDKPGPSRAWAEITAGLKKLPAWGATVNECVDAWRAYCKSLEEKRA